MPGKRGAKKKQGKKLPESSGQTQTTAEIDHAFAATDTGRKPFYRLPKLTRKQWLIAGVVLVLLVGAGGYAIWQNRTEPKPSKPTYSTEGVLLKKLNSEQLRTELQKLISEKKFSSAEQLINYQDEADSDQHKMLLALTYVNQNKPKDALRILKSLEGSNQNNWQFFNTVGNVYQQLGDKKNAVSYYKKALSVLKKTGDSPVQADDVRSLEQTIGTLEAQP